MEINNEQRYKSEEQNLKAKTLLFVGIFNHIFSDLFAIVISKLLHFFN